MPGYIHFGKGMNGRECRERCSAYIHRQNVPPSLHVSLGALARG